MNLLLISLPIVILIVIVVWYFFFAGNTDTKTKTADNTNDTNDNTNVSDINIDTDTTIVIDEPVAAPGSGTIGSVLDETEGSVSLPVADDELILSDPPLIPGGDLPSIGSPIDDTTEPPTSVPLFQDNQNEITNLVQRFSTITENFVKQNESLKLVASRRDRDEPNFFQTMVTRKVDGQWVPVLEGGISTGTATHPPRVESYYMLQG